MVGARLGGDGKVAAEEGGTELGDELLHRISLAAEAVGKVAVKTVLCACPVGELVKKRAVESLGRAGGSSAGEAAALRDADNVERGNVAGLVSALLNDSAGGCEEALGLLDRVEDRRSCDPAWNWTPIDSSGAAIAAMPLDHGRSHA